MSMVIVLWAFLILTNALLWTVHTTHDVYYMLCDLQKFCFYLRMVDDINKFQTCLFECEVNQDVQGQENIVHMVECIPQGSMQKITRRLDVPQTKVMLQRAHTHTMCSKCCIFVLAIFLWGYDFAAGPMTVAGYIVTSCLLMKCNNSVVAVSVIRTVLMCHQMKILRPLWKVTVWCAVMADPDNGTFILYSHR